MASAVPTVYVIDDEPDVLRALSRLLRSEGLQVRTFDDAFAFVAQVDDDFTAACCSTCRCRSWTAWRCSGCSPRRAAAAGGVPERQRRRRRQRQRDAAGRERLPVQAGRRRVLLGAVRAAIERGRARS
jgi:hypothetical protein